MISFYNKLRNFLSLPLFLCLRQLLNKIISLCWKKQLNIAGKGFFVSEGARIIGGKTIQVGHRFSAGKFFWLEAITSYRGFSYKPIIKIGDGFCCSDLVHIAAISSIDIGNSVLIGSKVHITDHGHGGYSGACQSDPDSSPLSRPLCGAAVKILDNVWLGDGVIVLPGVTIGEGTIVGANSVVTKNLPPFVIAVGAPAVPIKKFDRELNVWISIV
jgi:acetyltransferase-like isoleucine patch superfamily enzyme